MRPKGRHRQAPESLALPTWSPGFNWFTLVGPGRVVGETDRFGARVQIPPGPLFPGSYILPRVKHRRMATEDYDEAAERVKRQAAEQKQAFEEQHDALLDAAAADEELTVEETDTAHIGDATLTVTTELPGKVVRKLDVIYASDAPPGDTLDVYIDVLTAQTLSVEAAGYTWAEDEAIRAFFTRFIDEHDAEQAAVLCLERVVEEPVGLEQRRRGDAIQSFRGAQGGSERRRSRGGGSRP